MKIHAQEILKRNTQFLLFIGMAIMCFISTMASIKAISKSNHPIIIGIDSNGTRIVSEANDPIFKTEATAFIQKFLFNVYNFDSENFIKRIGYATSIMSEDLWKRKQNEILDLKNKIERDSIAISGQIQKLTKDENGTYHALILVHEKSRLNEQDHQIEVSLNLKSTIRNQENPSGLEVDSYEETIIRN
jgi:hypothetical protein